MTNLEALKEKYIKYGLSKEDVFKHQNYDYVIITRSGIEKIAAQEHLEICFEVVRCEPNFAVVKAKALKDDVLIETFGSALKGATFKDGNTNTFYVIEMAEKRALSRAVLKISQMYELGCYAEDESEDFKRTKN